MKIAIYGKGGIGKSTISSNISAYIAKQNKKVLQIGCDPKHDSTLLLLKDTLPTVLETITQKEEDSICANDLFQTGKYEIDCIEIGGPMPGVGCAGRGIIKGLEVINSFNLLDENKYDLITFDVLGDVVCGGFFEPLKKDRVDEIYIVTSGEFNSLFAANNICRGYLNCRLNNRGIKLAGIIGNYRGIENEQNIVRQFCIKLNVKLITEISRDNQIEESTAKGEVFVEVFQNSDSSTKIGKICDYLFQEKELTLPTPISLQELRELILNER